MFWDLFKQYAQISKDGVELTNRMYGQWVDFYMSGVESMTKTLRTGFDAEPWLTKMESFHTYKVPEHVRNCAAPVYLMAGMNIKKATATNDLTWYECYTEVE